MEHIRQQEENRIRFNYLLIIAFVLLYFAADNVEPVNRQPPKSICIVSDAEHAFKQNIFSLPSPTFISSYENEVIP